MTDVCLHVGEKNMGTFTVAVYTEEQQKRLGVDATVHGMRSAFKDWAAETTGYANEVSEMALSHAISSKVEAAYRRGNLLTKRKQMMADRADYVAGKQNKVISLHPNKEQA